MDKYHGVHVKVVLSNNDIVTGHIHGTDNNGNVLIKNGIVYERMIEYINFIINVLYFLSKLLLNVLMDIIARTIFCQS